MRLKTFEQMCVLRAQQSASDMNLNPESITSMSLFKRMAALGLLTTDSQEGLTTRIENAAVDHTLFQTVISDLDLFDLPDFRDEMWMPEYIKRGGKLENGVQLEKAYVNGVMLKQDAGRIAHTFNMLSDKIAIVVDVVDCVTSARPYSIPVTFMRFKSGALTRLTRNTAWIPKQDSLEGRNHLDGMKNSEGRRLSEMIFIDTKPGRGAAGRNGLHHDIIRALNHTDWVQ